jgi:hypothetical protein
MLTIFKTCWLIGDGTKTNFWTNNWLLDNTIELQAK